MTDRTADARLHIDWTRCDGRGVCVELLPDLLRRDDWGYPLATRAAAGSASNVAIDEQHLAAARDAVVMCPRLALTLLGTTSR